jgi:CheY-like chemotaxis protein
MMPSFWGKSTRQYILVVDSDQDAAKRMSDVIAGFSAGYEVFSACSGFEGVQKIEKGVVSIVPAAEKLVDMSGTTFINILSSLKNSNGKEPACVLMADNRKRVETAAFEGAAIFEVIRCPVDPRELAYVLDRVMNLNVLSGKILFNLFVGRVLLALIPVAIAVGVVLGKG